MYLIFSLPRELKQEIVKYCHTFEFVLRLTELFPVMDAVSDSSCRLLFQWAVQEGYLTLLKLAHENGCACNDDKICDVAARGGHLDILKWLKEKVMNGMISPVQKLLSMVI